MLGKIKKRAAQLGMFGVSKCIFKKIHFSILSSIFKFDKWHATAPYECRPYKSQVVDIGNSLNVQRVVEIGCGLGEIVARISVDERFGIDADPRVIQAARFLFKDKVLFSTASLEDAIYCLPNAPINDGLLLMINWIHNVKWEDLHNVVSELIKKQSIKYILVDGILPTMSGYQFQFSEKNFRQWGTIEKTFRAKDNVRNFYLIRVTK
jgi:SAM-dependent methyltransferase